MAPAQGWHAQIEKRKQFFFKKYLRISGRRNKDFALWVFIIVSLHPRHHTSEKEPSRWRNIAHEHELHLPFTSVFSRCNGARCMCASQLCKNVSRRIQNEKCWEQRVYAGSRYQKLCCGLLHRSIHRSHRHQSAVTCSADREPPYWSRPSASQVS